MYIPSFAVFWATYRWTIFGLFIVVAIVVAGMLAGFDAWLIASIATLVGILTQTFAGFLGLLALIPWLGPLLAKALSIPLIWLVNGAGYFLSVVLAGRGKGSSVVQSRILTVVLIIGLIVGFIIGKLTS